MHVVIVEDDDGISSFLVKGLRAEGYATSVSRRVSEAQALLSNPNPKADLVLLDLGLPGGDGTELLTWLRARDARTPVICLTARTTVPDKVAALNHGANDYVTKPFSFDELLARIRAAARAAEQPASTELAAGDLRLDLLTKVATRGGRTIDLAPREWALLELFLRHRGQVLSRQQILDHVWGVDYDQSSNVVDVYVGYLRRKLEVPGFPKVIETVRGAGYRLLAPPPE